MASDQDFMDYVAEQVRDAGHISYRKMFGEYALYCEGKVVALVCDNQLFVKPTGAGREFIGAALEAPPYPGGKPWFLIEEDLEDQAWISQLIRLTENELPVPKPRRKRASIRRKKNTPASE
jgi:TfoX/Sxy family transcriptional regulator of competence genes